MATTLQLLAAAVLAAAVIGTSATGVCSEPSNGFAFTTDVPHGCVQPFECFVDFCACVNGTTGATCTPFGDVNASVIEQCAKERVTCTLKAALNSRNVWNASCQLWGDDLASLYAAYYANHSFTNLTETCEANMCDLVSSGNSDLVSSVNYTAVCAFDVAALGAPVDRDEVVGCAVPTRTYFDEIPVAQCGGAANCSQRYCGCLGGTWSAAALECAMPAAQPLESVLESCLAAAVSCLTNAALDVYVPGASPLNTDPCQQWAVPIAEDFATFYNATRPNATITRDSTALWKACNYTACKDIYRFNHSAAFSSACSFAAVNRTPNFVAYNACPYSCPDSTCAADLASCACTAHAVITNLTYSSDFDLTNFVATSSSLLRVDASAAYGVASGNCSNFTFGSSLRFSWVLKNSSNAVVANVSGSTLTVSGSVLKEGSYTATVTATGLVSSQVKSTSVTITVHVPSPTVTVSGPTSASSKRSFKLTAAVANPATGATTYAWSCATTSAAACATINGTASTLFVPSNASAGVFTYTYSYNASAIVYQGSLTVTIFSEDIPVVSVRQPTGGIASSVTAYSVYARGQSVAVTGSVQYSALYTRSWSVNGVSVNGTADTVTINTSTLKTTTFADAQNANYTLNTITLTAVATSNATISGNATVSIVVLEAFTASLTVAKKDSTDLFATGLTDSLVFTATTAPVLSATSLPLAGAALETAIVYYTVLNNVTSSAQSLLTSGSPRSGVAPLYPGNASSVLMTFGVRVSLGGIVVASANATFNITRVDPAVAAASLLASTSSVTDPNQAVAVLGNIGALAASGTNASATAALASAGLAMLATAITNGTQLSSTQSVSVVSNIGSLLNLSTTTAGKAEASKKVVLVMLVVVTGASFNTEVAGAVGGAIAQMDPKSGGELAQTMSLLLVAQVAVGASTSVDMGSAGSMVVSSSTGASLSGAPFVDASGVGVAIPSTFIAEMGVDEDAVFGVVTVLLLISPFETNGTSPTSGIVSQDVTSNGASLSVSGLSSPIVILMPAGAGTCTFFDVVTNLWSSEGVTTVVTATAVECHTTHLTSFGLGASSAATVALSVLVVALAALLQLIAA